LYSKFENLDKEKKKKILDACIGEFSENSFEKASTNRIVKKAGISKGILYYYFGNKKNLYLYVFDYILDYVFKRTTEKFDREAEDLKPDILEKIMKSGLVKIQVAYENPVIYKALINAMYNCGSLQEEIQARFKKIYKKGMAWLLEGIDTSKFRKDIDMDIIIEFIFLTLDGISGKYMKAFKNIKADEILTNMESIAQEYYLYIKLLKDGIYVQG
jgi:TetR/AcrR family transcriptional regulator